MIIQKRILLPEKQKGTSDRLKLKSIIYRQNDTWGGANEKEKPGCCMGCL